MSISDVWRAVHDSTPHALWEGDKALGYWNSQGSCTVTLDPSTKQVTQITYDPEAGHFIGIP